MTQSTRDQLEQLKTHLGKAVVGQEALLHSLLLALICNGHVLIEGFPGTAKTRTIKALAGLLGARLGRIQFTPDLLPADVTGAEIYEERDGRGELVFEPGPIFNELVLADEINRAPAKVQSALLEAMEERQVTVSGNSRPLPELFMVMATQNPIEHEGTYPLPEAQLDRFLFKLNMGFPDAASEREILRLAQSEEDQPLVSSLQIDRDEIFAARQAIQGITVSETLETYIVDLIMATRQPADWSGPLSHWLAFGASPRASIALHRSARALAWLNGRDHVLPEDIQAVAADVLRHRVTLSYEALADRVSADTVIETLISRVAVG